jgi:hypothetical protein
MDSNFIRLDLLLCQHSLNVLPRVEPSDLVVTEMSLSLRRPLLQSSEQFRWEFPCVSGGKASVLWTAAGQTAGVAHWIIDRYVAVISALLSGLDIVEDLAAVQVLIAAMPRALPEQSAVPILQGARPLIASVCRNSEVLRDRAFINGSTALATAFFGILGAGIEAQNQSH